MHIKTSVVLTLRVHLIGKSGFRFWNPDFGFCNQTCGFHPWEIRPQGESGFHGFPFYYSTGKSEKRFAKLFSWTAVFFLLIMHAHARPLFLRTVGQILFRISQSNGTKGNPKTDISKPKSGFYDLNPDFPIKSTLKKRNIAMWSAQYDCWKKKNRLIREHLVVVVKPKKVLLTYTLFHNKIHNFFCSVTLTYIQEIY